MLIFKDSGARRGSDGSWQGSLKREIYRNRNGRNKGHGGRGAERVG